MAEEKRRDDYAVDMPVSDEKAFEAQPVPPPAVVKPATGGFTNSPAFPILSYCGASVLMTVTNKFVLSAGFNLNFFLLAVQVNA